MNEDRRQPFVFAASLDKQRYDRERAAASGTSGAGGGLGEPGAWTCRVALAENVPRRGWARGVEGEPVDSGGEEGETERMRWVGGVRTVAIPSVVRWSG